MKRRVVQVALGLVASVAAQAFAQTVPVQVGLCVLTERPEQFDGMVVDVRARLTDLKSGEWAMDDVCFRPVLLVLRADADSLPELDPSKVAILDVLSESLNQPMLVRANFVGRFEWSDSDGTGLRTKRFGRSQLSMRLVLRDVTHVERMVVPPK